VSNIHERVIIKREGKKEIINRFESAMKNLIKKLSSRRCARVKADLEKSACDVERQIK
jgi:hypothetical protein